MKGQTINVRSNASGQILTGALVIGGAAVAYFGIIRPILVGTGVMPSKYDKKIKKLDGFDPNYYKSHLGRVSISTSQADRIASEVRASYGFATAANTSDMGTFNPMATVLNMVGLGVSIGTGKYNYGNDDEAKLYMAIQSAGSEANLSKVSDVFQKNYGESMIDYIMKFANNDDTKHLYKMIKNY